MIKAIMMIYTGNLAEQLINGVTKIVSILSFQFSIPLADMIAGTAQAAPEIKGTTLFPLNPKTLIGLSIR